MHNKRPHNVQHLSAGARDSVLIASYFAVRKRSEAARVIKKGLSNSRLTEPMLSELFLHLSLLLGFPTMLDGFAMLRSATGKSDSTRFVTLSNKQLRNRGKRALKIVYGHALDRLLANLKSLHTQVPDLIIRDVYGRIIARPGLALRDREIINVAVLTIQGLDQQLYSHIRGALRLRVSASAVRTTILLASKAAGVNPASALSMVSSLKNPKTWRS